MGLDVMKAREIAARIGSPPATKPEEARRAPSPGSSGADTFADTLEQLHRPRRDAASAVKLSAHAEARIEQRDISLTRPERRALGQAMHALEAKGARDALLLRTDAAFVVNVPNRTVVTAINQSELQERIFTQIDSAMLV